MLRVGLTGGIGSGKSTVAGRLAEHGAVLIDADKLAREVVEPGTPGLGQLVEAFGAGILAADGSLDRPKLAAVVFNDAEQRERLNNIVHPLVGMRTAELLQGAADDAVVVHDVPLLVEKNYAPMYHLVVIVDADVEKRVHRLTSTRGMSEEDARARIAAQATEEQRRTVADVWLDNSSTTDEILRVADSLWADRLVPFEANVRLRRPAVVDPRTTGPDPTWPRQAARLIARITLVTGLPATHVGPTADGVPAQDVIEVEVTVGDNAEKVAEELSAAGFPGGDGVHHSADPGRPATIYLRQ
ncbi:dephospho-CoA kinase [Actinocrispum wychmicini]|uniref:Dephospho-CoA kinase n=1 Tax=Actinocrispum wychmicini TaxID=1213861 RepID=A0A4R2J906_9PSEU|nr:dephospho-CoA kinase [Actinocrispum wychmicini]TCO53048.1 dephospho-CoA kinase [Actinocrispum wychmicini]